MDELILKLKKRFPLSKRIIVKRVAMRDYGSTSLSNNTITICIKKGSPNPAEILAHEWAHAVIFDREGDHHPRWGKVYAECYQLI